MCFFISKNNKGLSIQKRDIDQSDLYKDYIYIHGLLIYGKQNDLEDYMFDVYNFNEEKRNLFLQTAINSSNFNDGHNQQIPIFKNNITTYITTSNVEIIKKYFILPDIIIVGCGTAGCCLAYSLRESNKRIVIVDPGIIYDDENVTNVHNFFTVWKDPKYTTIFGISNDLQRTTPVSHVYNAGGCSIHNGTIAVKPTQNYLNSLGPYFSEENINEANNDLFSEINLRSSTPSEFGTLISKTIAEVFDVINVENYNEHNLCSSSNAQLFQTKKGKRELLTKLLPQKSNFSYLYHFHVDKIIFNDNNQAIGISTGIRKNHIIYGSQIILCAGIESSCILEKSGIGNKQRLQSLNIPIVKENNHVGEHVKNQLGPTMVIKTSKELKPSDPNNLGTVTMGFLPDFYDSEEKRKYQIFSTYHPYLDAPLNKLYDFNGCFAINICDLNPVSEGSIHITSKECYNQPKIEFNYYKNKQDVQSGINSYKILYEIYQELQVNHEDYDFSCIFPPEDIFNDDKDIEKYVDIGTLIEEHYTSGCRIGDVVDEKLNVIGVQNLKIADCSVLKYPSDGNTQYIAMYVGWICGKLI